MELPLRVCGAVRRSLRRCLSGGQVRPAALPALGSAPAVAGFLAPVVHIFCGSVPCIVVQLSILCRRWPCSGTLWLDCQAYTRAARTLHSDGQHPPRSFSVPAPPAPFVALQELPGRPPRCAGRAGAGSHLGGAGLQ